VVVAGAIGRADAREAALMRPAEVVRRSADYLDRHGVRSPRETAETLLMHLLRTDRAGLYARTEGLDTRIAKLLGRALCQRCSGIPLQYITGEQPFLDLSLQVAPGVFVPRPETEGLVEAALEVIRGTDHPVVVDVGTGTGAIALAVKARRPDARVLATDVSEVAVTMARSNAARHGLAVDVRHGDLMAVVPGDLRGRVDLLVSNPPYVRAQDYQDLPQEVKAEPYEALVGGTQLHARLVQAAVDWLSPGGWLAVEIGDDQGPGVRALFLAVLTQVEVLPDLAGRDRVVRGRRGIAGS
jgi:release factor glutamine methyltransferase